MLPYRCSFRFLSPFALCVSATLLVALVPRFARAQLAPTGEHYAGRPSDSGFVPGEPTASGGYATSVPLELPAARGNVPLPLQIVYGARGVGAAGLGWDIPLSYIRSDASLAHRRPTNTNATSAPTASARVTMSLLGQPIDLVPSGGAWVARNGTQALRVVALSDGSLVAYDRKGFTYTFTQTDGISTTPRAELINLGIWLLHSIAATGNTVSLQYLVATLPASSGNGDVVQIDLQHVRYNTHPSTTCAKHDISLVYGQPAASALSLKVVGNGVLARMDTLSDVYVYVYANCSSAPVTLRQYHLSYSPDVDLDQPRLTSVTVAGRSDSAERATWLPVASYQYGSASHGGSVVYQKVAQSIALPSGANTAAVAATAAISSLNNAHSSGYGYGMLQDLTDFNGDGRPDLVFTMGGQLVVAPAQSNGSATTFGSATSFLGAPVGPSLDTRWQSAVRFSPTVTDEVWRKAIDVNGDGRIDIVDASLQAGRWVVFLNTPTPNGSPGQITWLRRSFVIKDLYNAMIARNLSVRPDYIPLSSRTTSRDTQWNACDHYTGGQYVDDPGGFGVQNGCTGSAGQIANPFPPAWEKSITEWDVRDINGDGFLDVVFDSKPVGVTSHDQITTCNSTTNLCNAIRTMTFGTPAGTTIDAVLNIAGMFVDDPTPTPFSAPIKLMATGCGVSEWVQSDGMEQDHTGTHPSGDYQFEVCGLVDVNGDGVPDRHAGDTFYLGTGTGFTNVTIAAAAPIAQQSWHSTTCTNPPPNPPESNAYFVAGLRDINGDGIPDAVENNAGSWTVQFGTGAGFNGPIPISAPLAFTFSAEIEACNGGYSRTQSGFFDLDGDGKPEVVQLNGASLDVYQLGGGLDTRVAEAGHLVGIDNGYGAHTSITYRSAKDDALTQHAVPFAEIVVSQIDTKGQYGLGGTLATTRYAYGNAQLFYDPMHERWSFPGYGRTIELRIVSPSDKASAEATLTDRYALPAFSTTMTAAQRFGRYLTAGRISDVTNLAGSIGTDPWLLLNVNIGSDAHRTGGTHFAYDTMYFPETSGATGWEVFDLMYPYDWAVSFGSNSVSFDATVAHGFVYRTVRDSWRGSAGPPSTNNVERRDTVRVVDAFGNPLSIYDEGDIYRSDDDTCIDTTFAAGTTPWAPASKPARRVLSSCNPLGAAPLTFAVDSWEYDQLAAGSVATGLPTAHTVERHADDNGVLLATIREFDAVYDAAGNLKTMTRTRDDGAQQVTTMSYDAFGLATTRVALSGTSVPTLATTYTVDPVSLATLTTTDADGTLRGTTYDGFLRPVLSTVKLPGGTLGALAQATYLGFGPLPDTSGRRVAIKRFTDAVATSAVASTPGRVSTTYLDELGRSRMTLVALGSDYASESLVVGARTYDPLGRVVFEADAYPLSQTAPAPYGTTRFFNPDRSPLAEIRGYGQQAFTSVPNAANELFPTLYTHSFSSHVEQLSVQDAASLTSGSQQNGVVRAVLTSALGRLLFRSTWKAGTRLEHAAFFEDHQGRTTTMIRYGDPVNAVNPVQRRLRYDSLGQLIEVDDATAAPQTRYFDSFGDITEIRTTPISPEPTHSVVQRYDAFGRVTHHEEQNGGTTDLTTVSDYEYDTGRVASPQVQPTYVLGRLAHASSPTSEEFFSYDGFGHVNARTFTDQNAVWYVERQAFHGDGSTASIELDLPDNSYNPERVDYAYDSSARLRSMQYSDASVGETTQLYHATTIDTFGRVRAATFPNATLTAQFADVGRRLPQSFVAKSSSGSRTVTFGTWDPVGRELTRTEDNGAGPTSIARAYDPLGRISIQASTYNSNTTDGWVFAYDALGNVTQMSDIVGSNDSALSYLTNDYDRICRIGYGNGGLGGTTCNVDHDSFGNVVNEAVRTGSRRLAYFNSGSVRHINDPSGTGDFAYDAFGRLQSIDVLGTADQQSDRNFGEHISSRYRLKGTMKASYLARKFPAGRFQVSRRGYRGPWVFELNEERGTRFAFDDAGAFVQDVTYAPFGEMRSTGPAMPATTRYSSDLWNGGEALDRFGLVQLGARLYDPVIGRFLSRDPLFVPRTAATTNPYAFAFNDPINHADPTGADAGDGNGSDGTTCEGDECQGPDGSGWGLGSGYYDDGGYFVYLPPPGYRPRANSPTHTDPVEPKPIVPFNEPTEDSEEDSDVDAGIEFGAFGLDFTGAGYDAAESAGWFAKHGSVFAEVSEIAGKVAGGFEVLGAAASGYGFVKHTDVEHTVDFGLSVGGASAALMGHPVVALVAFGGKLAWGWIVDQYHEDQKEYEAELRRWRFQNLILTGMHIADLYANRELKAEVDGALFRLSDEFVEQGCWLLGGHDSITEERTRVRDAGGGILIDGTPQNSSPIE